DLPEAREAELRAAAALLGVRRVELLRWADSGMGEDPPPGALVSTPVEEVAEAVGALLDELRPDVVVTLDASDGHRDHVHVRDATLAAVERMPRPPRTYLQCLPRSLMGRWAEEVRRRDPSSAYLELGELGTPDELITTVIDVGDHLDRRRAAIALHASQVPPFAVMPPPLADAFLGTDHLRRVVPPWTGGEREDRLFPSEGP
ncbi:MAG TPA: PIG-L family deacetylase, partial [Aquihabitans sp.]|nr:PIG-L family deacetylase [Aquihabitans sp.]